MHPQTTKGLGRDITAVRHQPHRTHENVRPLQCAVRMKRCKDASANCAHCGTGTDRRGITQGQIISFVKCKKNGNQVNMPTFSAVSCTAASSSEQQITFDFRVPASPTEDDTCHGKRRDQLQPEMGTGAQRPDKPPGGVFTTYTV